MMASVRFIKKEKRSPSPPRGTRCDRCTSQYRAEYMCLICKNKLLCRNCAKIHQNFRNHQLISLEEEPEGNAYGTCGRHDRAVTYYCKICKIQLCMECLFQSEHTTHSDDIVDIKEGVNSMRDGFHRNVMKPFKDLCKKMKTGTQIVKHDLRLVKTAEEELEKKYQDAKKRMITLKKEYETVSETKEELEQFYKHLSLHEGDMDALSESLDEVKYTEDEYCLMAINQSEKETSRKRKLTDYLMNYEYKAVRYVNTDETNDTKVEAVIKTVKDMVEKRSKYTLKKRMKVTVAPTIDSFFGHEGLHDGKRIKGEVKVHELLLFGHQPYRERDLKMAEPREIVGVGDGSILLVDQTLKYVQRINIAGKVVKKYHIDERYDIRSASVYGKNLFLGLWNKRIVKLSLDDAEDAVEDYAVSLGDIYFITAKDSKRVLISESGRKGRIIEYNTEKNCCTERVESIWNPGKVTVFGKPGRRKYIVAYTHRKTKENRVRIYDESWNPVTSYSIETLDNPKGMTVTPYNTILATDDGKCNIFQYSLDDYKPTKMSDLFANVGRNGLRGHPVDVVYTSPYLWVLQKYPTCIQMFLWEKD